MTIENGSNQIVHVPFYGDTIDAVQTDDGQVLVSIKRMCGNLGLSYPRQLEKLKNKAWAGVALKGIPDKNGDLQRTSMLALESVPMWLATVEPSRVKKEIRPKLAQYQKECARVLAEHFLGKAKANDAPAQSAGDITSAIDSLLSNYIVPVHQAQQATLAQHGQDIAIIKEAIAAYAPRERPDPSWITIPQQARELGFGVLKENEHNSIRARVLGLLEARGDRPHKVIANSNFYFDRSQVPELAKAICIAMKKYRTGRSDQRKLFTG